MGEISDDDVLMLDIEKGNSTAQQVAEGLCMLAALRAWHPVWAHQRVTLAVRGDSLTGLTMVLRMKTSGSDGMKLLSRELALDREESICDPDVGQHVPGQANVLADTLSWKFDSNRAGCELPQALVNVPRRELPRRGRTYYRSRSLTILSPPGVPQGGRIGRRKKKKE